MSLLFLTPWIVAHRVPWSMEFSRQEYWNGLPFSTPGDLPHPGIETSFLLVSCNCRLILYHCTTWKPSTLFPLMEFLLTPQINWLNFIFIREAKQEVECNWRTNLLIYSIRCQHCGGSYTECEVNLCKSSDCIIFLLITVQFLPTLEQKPKKRTLGGKTRLKLQLFLFVFSYEIYSKVRQISKGDELLTCGSF